MQKVFDILPSMIDSLGIHQKFKSQLIFFYWDKIVGSDIAAQSVPVEVEYGTLYISVANSVWSHHLLMMKAEILYKINHFLGEPLIRDIKFKNNVAVNKKLEEDEEDKENLISVFKDARLSQLEEQKVHEQCDQIADSELKSKVYQVYKKHLRMEKAKSKQNFHQCGACDSLCPEKELYCYVCSLHKKQETFGQIRRALMDVPWATYAEINQYIPCTPPEYIDAKVTLLNNIASSISVDDENSMKVKVLTMLFTGAKFDKVDARLMQKTLAKFRRKIYVSTPRS